MPVKLSCQAPPDPLWAEQNFARLRESYPKFPFDLLTKTAHKRLLKILGFSPYATNLLLRREDLLRLFLKEPFPSPFGPLTLWKTYLREARHFREWRDFALWLRKVKQREILKILVKDLEGEKFARTVYRLSNLADFFLRAALNWLTSHQFSPDLEKRFLILGMGKLGGRELNYSSDIDLIYFYQGNLAEKETFVSLAREITRLLDQLLEGERLFRVDLRLRPGGKDGELIYSLKAGLSYYFYQSHPFERLALVKARPVAGNLKIGKGFLRALRPVVYPRFLDYTYLEHLKDLKDRLQKEAFKKGAERDLKIGPGGIRGVEFFCQALQMIYGGKEPGLRTRNTLWALKKLAHLGLIPTEEASFLKEAYIFLRTVEHRLQTVHFRQTHTLPSESAALLRLARSLGFTGEEALEKFEEILGEIRRRINSIFESLFRPTRPPKGASLKEEVLSFLEGQKETREISDKLSLPPRLLEDSQRLLKTSGPLAKKRAPVLKAILREALTYVSEVPKPELALARFLSFLERLGGRLSFFYALKHQPEKILDLLNLFARSNFLNHLLQETPAAAEALFRKRGLPALEPLLSGKDTEEGLGLLRMAKNEELFRLGFLDLKGKLSLEELLAGLSSLAYWFLEGSFRLARLESPKLPTPLVVLGLGKLGGRELGYRSDLDMVFVAQDHENLVPHTKLAQKFIHFLTTPLPEGPGYEVDTRLRPEGRKGPLVVTLSGFLTYYQKDAAWWEKLALCRLRAVTGNLALGKEILKKTHLLLANNPPGPKEAEETWQMRLKMEKERCSGRGLNIKVGRGGLADLEFALQWLLIKNLAHLPLEGNFLKALEGLKNVGAISPPLARIIRENYLFLRRLDQFLILLFDKSSEEKEYQPEEIKACEEYLGPLEEKISQILEFNRSFLEKALESDGRIPSL